MEGVNAKKAKLAKKAKVDTYQLQESDSSDDSETDSDSSEDSLVIAPKSKLAKKKSKTKKGHESSNVMQEQMRQLQATVELLAKRNKKKKRAPVNINLPAYPAPPAPKATQESDFFKSKLLKL